MKQQNLCFYLELILTWHRALVLILGVGGWGLDNDCAMVKPELTAQSEPLHKSVRASQQSFRGHRGFLLLP